MSNRDQHILIVDNDKSICWVLEKAFAEEGYTIHTASDGKSGLERIQSGTYALVVMDVMMPVMDGITALGHINELDNPPEVIIMTAHSNMENTVEAMKLGSFESVVKPFDIDHILSLGKKAIEKYKARIGVSGYTGVHSVDTIIGSSEEMRELYKQLGRIASTDAAVLITGETGTGKDLFARAIHYHSTRRDKSFVTVNCASIPGELLESELFGHVKGAFTGATDARMGKCELAHGGTLFLDEIGAMRLDLQAKLLTFLQRNEFERVGSSKTIHVDVRVLAATNAGLREMVANGEFREDLYYRLMVVPIHIPPLRERRDDIVELARYFAERYSTEYAIPFTLTTDTIQTLKERDWPGNVRELQNYVHRMVVLRQDEAVDVGLPVITVPEQNDDIAVIQEVVHRLLNDEKNELLEKAHALIERPLLEQLMARLGGNQSEAAKRLGISRNTLRKLLDLYTLLQ